MCSDTSDTTFSSRQIFLYLHGIVTASRYFLHEFAHYRATVNTASTMSLQLHVPTVPNQPSVQKFMGPSAGSKLIARLINNTPLHFEPPQHAQFLSKSCQRKASGRLQLKLELLLKSVLKKTKEQAYDHSSKPKRVLARSLQVAGQPSALISASKRIYNMKALSKAFVRGVRRAYILVDCLLY